MKIGILTFHRAHNYGALLQCYALQTYLEQLGHVVDVIDYRQPAIEDSYKKITFLNLWSRNFKRLKVNLFLPLTIARNRRNAIFDSFISNYIHSSKKSYHRDDLISGYDLIVVGSDQLWNPKWTKCIDPFYWGDFKRPSNIKLCTYAISLGESKLPMGDQCIKKLLENFSHISVREESLRSLIQPLTDTDISIAIDPTLLLPQINWYKFLKNKPLKDDYVLIYPLKFRDETIQRGIEVANQLGCNYYIVEPSASWKKKPRHIYDAGPIEFINLIAFSKAVVTSSFHGTVFSIIFEKQFHCVMPHEGDNTRVEFLLCQLGLENQIVYNKDDMICRNIINYNTVNENISIIREYSINYLNVVLNETK